MEPKVQISLDLTSIPEALETAHMAVRAGVDWLEAGTPLVLAEGLHSVRALRDEFPTHPIVADLKIMDGGYLEAELAARAGATHVVVMARAHPSTLRVVVEAAKDYDLKVMGDDLGAEDKAACARMMEEMGVDFIIHHVGYDERREIKGLSPLHELADVVKAVGIPVQAVGGLTIEQAIQMPKLGAPLVVLGAPLVIDSDAFKPAGNDLEAILREIVTRIRS
ncbi:MAG: orotidine 5'-phosphate decarboxylase [Acidobacteria bacterium]|nr:orotidine 5'-phosphate decarboxylase [Acidobacteriota bacterium]